MRWWGTTDHILHFNLNSGTKCNCFVALQSSSCLSRVRPVSPHRITNSCQLDILKLPLPLAPRIPNLQPKLYSAVSVVNLLASCPKSESEFEALTHWKLAYKIYIRILMSTGWETSVLFLEGSKALQFGFLSLCNRALSLQSLIIHVNAFCSYCNQLHLGSQMAWHSTIKSKIIPCR